MNFILWVPYRIKLFAILLLLSTSLSAQLISYNQTDFSILEQPMLLISDSFSSQDITTKEKLFNQVEGQTINLMYQEKNCWIKTKLLVNENISDATFGINYPLLNTVKFYTLLHGNIDSSEITLKNSIAQRDFLSQNFVHVLPNLNAGDTLTIFACINAELPITLPLEISRQKEYISKSNFNNIIIAVYLGLMLCIFLYNLFVFISVKDRNYLYYVIYIFFIAIAQLGLSGFLIRYILPTGFNNTAIIIIASILSGVSAIKFSSNFIALKQYAPKLNKGLYLFYLGYLSVGISFFAGSHLVAFRTLDLLGVSICLYALWFSIYVSSKGYRPAKFFFIAWIFFILGLVIFVLRSNGILANSLLTSSSLLWGSSIEALLLSFALADKINFYRKEKEIAQADALQKAQENERIIREQNATLELKVTERTKELNHTNEELNKTLTDLKETQTQLVESEKMASLGQLTAGIAHEINNPINFVTSNVKPLRRDVDILLDLMKKIETIATSNISTEDKQKQINATKTEYDFDYLTEEVEFLLKGINEGSTRTATIVKGLRIFSRLDEDDLKKADVNEGLDSTIIIVNNQLNGRIKITRNYANLPLAECYPGKLNQVFLNMISNAIYAIHKKFEGESGGEIIITTQASENIVSITFADNGIGMSEATQHKLFEPFFTTKPVGEGTGLGLSISYNTIKKHHGTISVKSESDKGTEFKIEIPIIQINP